MGIESYGYKGLLPYWASAVSPPHKNATNVEECGCCIVTKEERWEDIASTIIFVKIT